MIRMTGGVTFARELSPIRVWDNMVTDAMEHVMFRSRVLPNRAQMNMIREDLRLLFDRCCERINVSKEEVTLIKSECTACEEGDAHDFVGTWADVCNDVCNVEKMHREQQFAFLKSFWTFVKAV